MAAEIPLPDQLSPIEWLLISAGEPRMFEKPEEYLHLLKLLLDGNTLETRKSLERRAKKILAFWLGHFGITRERGRPRAEGLRRAWAFAADLKRGGRSVPSLARAMYPQEYLKNPRGVTDRVRKGIATALRSTRPA